MSLAKHTPRNHPQQVGVRGRGPRLFASAQFSDTTDDVDDRATPDDFWRPLHEEFGFTFDAAAAAHNAKCPRYATKEDDGLLADWHGEVVWCNPPYSEIAPWVKKAHRETGATVVMLLPANRTEQRWWQEYVEPHRDHGTRLSTRFVSGRLRFYGPDGSRLGAVSPPFGCVLLVWRAA